MKLPRPAIFALGMLAGMVLRLLGRTWRRRSLGQEHEVAARKHAPRVIFALPHGRMLIPIHDRRLTGMRTLVSRHADGEFLSGALWSLGYLCTRGSTRRGGAEAFLELARNRDGGDFALTPDGPRGPAFSCGEGIFRLAERTGRPVVPVTSRAHPSRRLSSWDQFLLPYPFARTEMVFGPALLLPSPLDSAGCERLARELGAWWRQHSAAPPGTRP